MVRSDTADVLATVTEVATSLLPASASSLILWNADEESFDVSASTVAGQPPHDAQRRVRRSGGASRWIIDHQEPVAVSDVEASPFPVSPMLQERGFKSYLGVPVVFEGESLGVLYALDHEPREYTEADIAFMTVLARRAASAIGFAKLFEQVEELAHTDELTGVANRREFVRRGEEEFERDRRTRRGLAVIVLDLDHFKSINDGFGHAIGDEVLVEIAARCRRAVRSIDLVSRMGGEEFAVLLPEETLEGARCVAERIRRSVADEPVATSHGPIAITITLGVAARTASTASLSELLDCADRALYAGKRGGRDRVVADEG